MTGTGGIVVRMPRKADRPIPRSAVQVEADLLAKFVAKLDAGELTAGPVGRSYLEGALAALRQVLGEGRWELPDDLDRPDSLQDTND